MQVLRLHVDIRYTKYKILAWSQNSPVCYELVTCCLRAGIIVNNPHTYGTAQMQGNVRTHSECASHMSCIAFQMHVACVLDAFRIWQKWRSSLLTLSIIALLQGFALAKTCLISIPDASSKCFRCILHVFCMHSGCMRMLPCI